MVRNALGIATHSGVLNPVTSPLLSFVLFTGQEGIEPPLAVLETDTLPIELLACKKIAVFRWGKRLKPLVVTKLLN